VRKDFDDLRTQFLADAASRAAPKAITQTRSPLDMVTPGETFLAEGRTWARSYFLGGREYSSAFGFLPIVNAISAQPRLSQELQALTAAYRKKHQPDMLFFVGGLAVSLAGDVVIIVAAQATPVDQGATIIGGSVALLGLGGAFLAGITMGRDPPDAIIDRYNHETGE
jgi:hypothetical protein